MSTKLQRLRKRQRFNRHVGRLTDKKRAAFVRQRAKRARQKRLAGLERLRKGEAVERAREAKAFKNPAPHPFAYEEQKARAALREAATRIDQYGRTKRAF
ncbi:MAG: hypothetical protein IIB35_06840 [Gemmatimonadetes bacterium]|nr:hypothetical protein [Gemmatimonadota bacterium]